MVVERGSHSALRSCVLRLLPFAPLVLCGCAASHGVPDAGTDSPVVVDTGRDTPPPDVPDAQCVEMASAPLSGLVGGIDLSGLDVSDAMVVDCLGGLELTMDWSSTTSTTIASIGVLGHTAASEPLDGVDVDATLTVATRTTVVGSVAGTLHFIEGDPVGAGPLRYRGSFECGSGAELVTSTFDFVVCDPAWCL